MSCAVDSQGTSLLIFPILGAANPGVHQKLMSFHLQNYNVRNVEG